MKLNKLFLLLLALPLAFAACEPIEPETPQAEPVLTLTSENSLQFTPEGGQGTITYTLENAVNDTELTATTTVTWITDITVGEQITFAVAANEATEERTGRIMVSYGDKAFNVFIKQEGVGQVVNFEAQILDGVYYGTQYSPNYNIAIYLSDIGFNDEGYALANGTYYALDLFVDIKPTIDAEGYLHIPTGTYTFDGTDSYEDMSIGYTYTSYSKVNADASAYEAQSLFDSAELVVTENGLTLVAYIEGIKHVATYTGEMKFFYGIPAEITGGTIEAQTLYGFYYDTKYSSTFNYNLYLSDQPLDPNGYAVPGAYYFSLDLYGLEPVIDAEGYLHVPVGTYTNDANDDFSEWEVGREYSGAKLVNDEGTSYAWEEAFTDVTVVVSENGIKVDCIIADAEFHVTYVGEPKINVTGVSTFAANKRTPFVPAKKGFEIR